MKKLLSLFLICIMALSGISVFASASFIDMDSSHWAIPSINILVEEGTIKGYEDGSFKPNNTVTRAEFVKMIGKGTEKREIEFDDVNASHWGYEYIIYSGLEGTGNNFEPDRAITRGETVELLWKRAGAIKNAVAPEFVKAQLPYAKDAVAWIYSTGVMIGNDGFDLRLNDTLTRAEAAALIIKSRTSKTMLNTVDLISEDILKYTFDASNLFDFTYGTTVTYGEMSRAALRYATDNYYVSYETYYSEIPFEHPYARDFFIMGNILLGKEFVTKENIDKPVTVEDAVKMLSSSVSRRRKGSFKYPITLYANDMSSKVATTKDIAAILVQFDEFSGMSSVSSTAKDGVTFTSLQKDVTLLPSNYASFALVTKGIPTEIYEKSFIVSENVSGEDYGNPDKMFIFAKAYSSMFLAQLDALKKQAKTAYGIDLEFEFYPELVYNSGTGFAVRTKCTVVNNGGKTLSTSDLFTQSLMTNVNEPLANGMSFYVELNIPYSNFAG